MEGENIVVLRAGVDFIDLLLILVCSISFQVSSSLHPLWSSCPLLSSLDRLAGPQKLYRIIQEIASSILHGCRVSVYTKLYQSLGW
jgi:hypothetical protein